eukprot:gene8601-10588_t
MEEPGSQCTFLPTIALKIERVGDSVLVKNAEILKLTDNLTFSVWIHPTKSGYINSHYLWMDIVDTYALCCCPNGLIKVAFKNQSPGWNWISSGVQIPINKWTLIIVTYDSSKETSNIYINGVLAKKLYIKGKLEPDEFSSLVVKLMRPSQAEDEPENEESGFTGMFSNLKIWNVALSEEQIRDQLSLDESKRDNPYSLIGWWRFDEGYGRSINDSTGNNANPGIIKEPRWWLASNANVYKSLKIPNSTLQLDLKNMMKSPIGVDISLTVEGYSGPPIQCHKLILANRSEIFKAMFSNGMRESTLDEIVFKDISFPTLSSLIEYLYTDNVEINQDNVFDLFIAADR